MIATHPTARISIAALALALAAAGGAAAQEKAWDQARVGTLASAFAEAAGELKNALRREGNPDIASMQSRSHHELIDQVQLIEREARHLAKQVEAGRDHDQTFSIYRRIQVLIRDAQTNARKLMMKQPVQEKIDAANDALGALQPYYASA